MAIKCVLCVCVSRKKVDRANYTCICWTNSRRMPEHRCTNAIRRCSSLFIGRKNARKSRKRQKGKASERRRRKERKELAIISDNSSRHPLCRWVVTFSNNMIIVERTSRQTESPSIAQTGCDDKWDGCKRCVRELLLVSPNFDKTEQFCSVRFGRPPAGAPADRSSARANQPFRLQNVCHGHTYSYLLHDYMWKIFFVFRIT